MLSLRTIFLTFIGLNFIGFMAIYFYSTQFSDDLLEPIILPSDSRSAADSAELEKIYSIINPADSYIFLDPKVALYILNALDNDHHYPPTNSSNFSKPFIGLKYDQSYCVKWRTYFTEHPEEIFEDYNVLMDFPESHLVRSQVLPKIGNDIQKLVSVSAPADKKNGFTWAISSQANGFFFNDMAHNHQQIGKSFACLGQMYNHIPGHGGLNRKDLFPEYLLNYSKLYQDKPQCFNPKKFTPQTWVLSIQDQCLDFFAQFNSKEYQELKKERTIVYTKRVGKTIQPVDDAEENEILKTWNHGELCGKVAKSYIIQTRIHNPLLLKDGSKFDLRMYMLVASANPVVAFYHEGLFRVSVPAESDSILENQIMTGISQPPGSAPEASLINGLSETELKNIINRNLTEFQNYLSKTGQVSDPNWIDNYLRPETKKVMIHLIRMSQKSFLKLSTVYEIFSVDFILDENLNLWYLESSSSPSLTSNLEQTKEFMIKMLQDHYEIVIGLLRSRVKRMIDYLNVITQEVVENKNDKGKYELKEIPQKKKNWNLIIKNKFEPEFEPSSENGWQKIIDENLEGRARYSNYIAQECLL